MQQLLDKLNIQQDAAISNIAEALLCIAFIVVFVVLIKRSFDRFEKRATSRGDSSAVLHVISKSLRIIIVIFGIMALFSKVPALRRIFSTLLASSGVVALVLSLAAQDAIGNIVGGIMISISKPFKVGDTIRFIDTDTIGVVTKITTRHTVIRTNEEKYVIIPNGTINSSIIENITFGGDIRLYIEVAITYESDIKRAMELFAASIESQSSFKDGRTDKEKKDGVAPVVVNIRELGASEVVLRASALVPDWNATFTFKTGVYLTMLNRIQSGNENVSFAYPHVVVVNN